MNPVIQVENLIKEYPLPRARRINGEEVFRAVDGLSFEVYKGEIFGILGPNGAGKTTTLEIIETLRKSTSGSVKVLGLDIVKDRGQVKRKIGVQLQSSNYINALSLKELIELFASLYGVKPDSMKLLSLVGLEDKAHFLVKNLSGGQKQRFTIAASLAHNPEIVFLDEPTTGLDPRARRDIWELVKKVQATGVTIVLTTHYMEEAEFLCDRVAIVDKGKVLTIDKPKTLIENLKSTIQISFLSSEPLSDTLWNNVPAITKVYNAKPKVILEVKELGDIAQVVEILKSNKVSFSSFTVKTATLEEVYLELTGKEYLEV